MITAILARSDDNIIGVEGRDGPALPWRLAPDLRRFRELTTGHAVIMGRKTFESIGRPLPNRRNIVLTRDPHRLKDGGVDVYSSPESALEAARRVDSSPFIIGGADTYQAFWPKVERVELTEVHTKVGLGTVMVFDRDQWRESFRSEEQEHDGLRFQFVTLEKKGGAS